MGSTTYQSSIGSVDFLTDSHTAHNINVNLFNMGNVIADEDREIKQWLSPLEPWRRHQDVRADRLGGVWNWVPETNEFRRWRSCEGGADEAILFCYGDPGVGKTYFSSLVIDNLLDESGEDISIAMFYADFRDQQQQTASNIIGAILKQLAVRGKVMGLVQAAFQKMKNEVGGRHLLLPDMVRLLNQALAKLPRVFICIDALDECLPWHQLELLLSLKDTLREFPRTRIFATGRPQAKAEITRWFPSAALLSISPKTQDIKQYLERKLEMDPYPDVMSDSLRADILRIIPESDSEIFLLVSLHIDAILAEITVHDRYKKLCKATIGNRVEDTYASTLARIRAQKGTRPRIGMEALMWVANAERALHTSELCHALGVEIGSTEMDDENIPAIQTLLTYSLGLITVDASSTTVRLVHLTLQKYLSNNPSLFHSPHSMIAEVCLTYLNFQSVWELSPNVRSAPPTFPLLEYASWYWGTHTRMRETKDVSPLAFKLLIGFEEHISAQLLLLRYDKHRRWWHPRLGEGGGPNGFTGLHGAASLGIAEIVAALLEMKEWDLNAKDTMGRTALSWAASAGHGDVVKAILEREGVNPDTTDPGHGQTPLLLAVRGGHEGVVKLLLERDDVNPNTADTKYGQTPLWCAAADGHEGLVKLLLERDDINPETANYESGQTPLLLATRCGHERIVKLLLERGDTDPNTADTEFGQTSLWWAADRGDEGVAKLLLERKDTNPYPADASYRHSPLWHAADRGHEGVIKLLLERDYPNTAHTQYGRPLLLWAAQGGYEGIVKLLLERGDTDPNTADTKYGRTPLLWAVGGGHEGVVKLLLEQDDTNPNTPDTKHCQTPLLWAVNGGHEGIVKLLLARDDINPNTPDAKHCQTPLLWATRCGREEVVMLLLQREATDLNTTDTKYGQTPLLFAARDGCERIVRLLLEREDCDPNAADNECGQTPLSWAAQAGHEEVIKLLLERGDIDPNTADTRYGQTPLSWAAEAGHDGVIKLLLERDDIDPDAADTRYGRTPLLWAARGGHEGVVKLLSERDDIDPNTTDTQYGQTPLSWAVEGGHEQVVKLLLERDDTNPDIRDLSGKTPLELASSLGYTSIVELLSKRVPERP